MGTGGCVPEVKRSGREADYLTLSSAEVKNEWSYASTPVICLHGVCSEIFTFFFFTRQPDPGLKTDIFDTFP
jgi:hypothetical protein